MTSGNIMSVLIFLITTVVLSFLIANARNYKKSKKTIIFFIFILSIFSYIFKPLTPIDLTRLQDTLKNYNKYSLMDIARAIPYTADFSRLIYFWIISKTNIDSLLQVGAVLIYYSIIFYFIYDFCKNHNVTIKTMGLLFLIYILLGQFIFVTSGIRTALSFAIFIFAFYREYFKNKSLLSSIFLYLIAIGFHSAIIPIFIIRVSLILFDKKSGNTKLFNSLIILLVLLLSLLYGKEVIDSFIGTSNTYLSNVIYFNRPEYYLAMIKIILHVIIFLFSKSYIKKLDYYNEMKNYFNLVFCIIFITLLLSFQYTIFTRYTYLLDILVLPLLGLILNRERYHKKSVTLFELILIVFLIMITLLAYFKANASIINFF